MTLHQPLTTVFLYLSIIPVALSASNGDGQAVVDPIELLAAQKKLQAIKKEYTEAVADEDHDEAAELSGRAVLLLEKLLGPDDEQVGVQALATGQHLLRAKRSEEALPYLRQAVEIIPDSNPSKQKLAYEYLLIALAVRNQNERTGKFEERTEDFVKNVHILGCLILPPYPDNVPAIAEDTTLEFPRSAEEKRLAGWAILTHSIDKNGNIEEPEFRSIWPRELVEEPLREWLEARRYEPLVEEGRKIRLEEVPLVVIYKYGDPGFQPPGLPYQLWKRALRQKWDSEQAGTYDCREAITEDLES